MFFLYCEWIIDRMFYTLQLYIFDEVNRRLLWFFPPNTLLVPLSRSGVAQNRFGAVDNRSVAQKIENREAKRMYSTTITCTGHITCTGQVGCTACENHEFALHIV